MRNPFRHSIFLRLSLALFAVMLMVTLAYIAITSYAARNYYLETAQRLNAHVAEHLIHEVPPFKDGVVNEQALGTIMHSMMAVNPSIEVYLLDTAGSILSYVVLDKKVKLKSVNLQPVRDALRAEGKKFILGDDPRNPGKEVIFSVAPVQSESGLDGYVYIVLQSEEHELISGALQGSYFMRVGTWAFALTLLAAFVIGLGLIFFLTRGLRKIQSGVRAFESGEHHHRIAVQGSDELAQLAISINSMSDTILRNMDELKKVDGLRRELIANVSHDLRSPMAVIHGYVETYMMKRDTLNDEEQKQYLETILQNSDKLNKLVNDLFELSKLEAKQMTIRKEPVLLNEMLDEMCVQFSLMAQKNNIRLKTHIPQSMKPVQADSHLMGRALQNLLDNAVKYTDANGAIEVKAGIEREKLNISVSNSGRGIAPDDLPHVFDRYYKANHSNPSQSTGLGLAIAKKIIALHDGHLTVASVQGRHTTFSIELPLASA